jgi:excisionase family DNA binding protein
LSIHIIAKIHKIVWEIKLHLLQLTLVIVFNAMTLLYSPTPDGDQQEVENLRQLETVIAEATPSQVRLTVSDSLSIPLPKALYELLLAALGVMAEGKAISLVPVSPEVTTTQAAELLNVSRPYLARLLDEEAIPYHRVGTHRRILLEDLLAYKSQRERGRKEGLQRLADLSQEYGLYDLSYSEGEAQA